MKVIIWKDGNIINKLDGVFSVSSSHGRRVRMMFRIDPGDAQAAVRSMAYEADEYDTVESIDEQAPVHDE